MASCSVQIGDLIVFPSKSDHLVNFGEVTGEYTYDHNAHEYVHQRGFLPGTFNIQSMAVFLV